MSDETLKEIASTLHEMLKWTKFSGMQQLKTILQANLKTETEMLVYELSDGVRGTREVARLAGIASKTTVLNYWKKWSKVGIVMAVQGEEGRYQRICSLEEVGLTVPPLPQPAASPEEGKPGEENE
jgi:hypothetical protein